RCEGARDREQAEREDGADFGRVPTVIGARTFQSAAACNKRRTMEFPKTVEDSRIAADWKVRAPEKAQRRKGDKMSFNFHLPLPRAIELHPFTSIKSFQVRSHFRQSIFNRLDKTETADEHAADGYYRVALREIVRHQDRKST